MADKVQLNIPEPQLNQWGTLTFEVPDYLANTREKINEVAEVLIAALDIVLTALDLVKTLLVGYLDPISGLLTAILNEINSMIKDLRQLGVHITSDYKLLEWPYDELRGGYKEFERRMIGRLTDLSDPTRPNVSAYTEVLSMFFYLSADASSIEKLIVFIDQMLHFFNQSFSRTGSLPTATLAPVLYGADAASLVQGLSQPGTLPELYSFSATAPKIAKVRWSLSSTAQRNPFNPVPPLPPGGFIVTVSTVQDGLQVVYDTPRPNATMQPTTTNPDNQTQPRDYGQVRVGDTGNPLILFGGADMITEDSLLTTDGIKLNYNQIYQSAVDNGTSRVYAQLVSGNDGIIPLEQLKQEIDGKTIYLLQRTFYVPSTEKWASWVEGNFSYLLAAEDMPYTCKWVTKADGTIVPEDMEPATTVYVRVSSCSSSAFDNKIVYQFQSPNAKGGGTTLSTLFRHGLGSSDISSWSQPVRVTFPSANTQAYLEALKAALAVLVLSRPDLPLLDKNRLGAEAMAGFGKGYQHLEVAAEACGLEGLKQLAGVVYKDYQAKILEKGGSPTAFRHELLKRIETAAHNIYNTTGANPQIEKIVVDQTKYLRSVTWGQIFASSHSGVVLPDYLNTATILQSLDINQAGEGDNNGLGLNPYSIGVLEDAAQEWFYIPNLFHDRTPQMLEWSVGSNTDPGFTADLTIPKSEVANALAKCPPGMRKLYETYRMEDAEGVDNRGGITIPTRDADTVFALVSRTFTQGSADMSPVFFLNAAQLMTYNSASMPTGDLVGGLYFCRGLFAATNKGQILHEASVALSLAGSAIQKSLQDGQWTAYRFMDMLPGLDDFFSALKNWLESVQKSLKSIVDTIKKYIQFIESRIVELQQLIRRINAILQSLLGFTFQIPQCSALVLASKGTQGVLADLVQAKNKPADSPLAYGAGIAVVIPFGPSLAMDLVKAIFVASTDNPIEGATMSNASGPTAIGIEGLPAPTPSGDQPPDVL